MCLYRDLDPILGTFDLLRQWVFLKATELIFGNSVRRTEAHLIAKFVDRTILECG